MAGHDYSRELARCFGENVVRIRKAAGISQEVLGFAASLHRTEIGMLERGVRLPRIDTVIKLAGALEVEPGDLLTGMAWVPAAEPRGKFVTRETQGQAE